MINKITPFIELLEEIKLPIVKDDNDSIEVFLQEKIRDLHNNLANLADYRCLSDNFNNQLRTIIDTVYCSQNRLIKSINCFNDGLEFGAFQVFSTYMKYDVKRFYRKKLSLFNDLYRVRQKDVLRDDDFSAKEMFHIPFTQRYKISMQRYSLNGTPCLYLGTKSFVCWVESGCPDSFYVSKFQLKDKETGDELIYFCKPKFFVQQLKMIVNNEKEEGASKIVQKQIEDMLLLYLRQIPLIIACSICKADRKNIKFNEEYIIPQLLMRWITQTRSQNNIRGIAYFSCLKDSIDNSNLLNIAMPCYDFDDEGLSKDLRNKFLISKPQLIETEKAKVDFIMNLTLEYFDFQEI